MIGRYNALRLIEVEPGYELVDALNNRLVVDDEHAIRGPGGKIYITPKIMDAIRATVPEAVHGPLTGQNHAKM